MTESKLSKYEMACLTAQVPCSGDPQIDKIISISLRLRLATDMLNGILSCGVSDSFTDAMLARDAVKLADALLKEFEGKKP